MNRRRLQGLLLAAFLPLVARASEPSVTEVNSDSEIIYFDAASTTPIVSYRVTNPLVAHYGSLELQIYGDGKIISTRPIYMKESGSRERQLKKAELNALLQRLLLSRIVAPSDEAPAGKARELTTIEDGDQVRITFNLLSRSGTGKFSVKVIEVTGEAPQSQARMGLGGNNAASLAKADALLRNLALQVTGNAVVRPRTQQ